MLVCNTLNSFNLINEHKKRVSYLYRTAQPFTLATFLSWGSSTGAGRIRLTRMQRYNFLRSKKHIADFSLFLAKFLTFALNPKS